MINNFNKVASQPFYNTIGLTEKQWKKQNLKAAGLQQIVFLFFKQNWRRHITGWQMWAMLKKALKKNINLLSVRRSLTNLKNEGKIQMLQKLRIGEAGQPEHFYAWKSKKNKGVYINKKSKR